MPRRRRQRGHVGFTLIEVLTVIAIIGLLISILIPGLSRARSVARRAVCQANLRQITVGGIFLDVEDRGGKFLRGVRTNLNFGGLQGQGSVVYRVPKPLNPYFGLPMTTSEGGEFFGCPSDKGGAGAGPTHFEFYGTSYQTNLFLIGQDKVYVNPWADPCAKVLTEANKRLPELARSHCVADTRLILVGDHGWINEWDIGHTDRVEWHDVKRHHNVAFMDGHVELLKIVKGLHSTPNYTVLPFYDLEPRIKACQKEKSTP